MSYIGTNNVNPFEICNNWIQLNMVFHAIKFFFGNMKIKFLAAILVILCIIAAALAC